ncbi:MAG: isochorismatase family cysteine hydrolase [Candidatus Micrarchaeota archaeon]
MIKTKKALIVIDVQNYFINEHTEQIPGKIAEYIRTNKSEYEIVLFTKFVNSDKSNFFRSHGWDKCAESPETDIHHTLTRIVDNGNSHVFVKDTFSAFKNEKLVGLLRENGITEIHLCGTDTEACVLSSAYDAFDLGFKVKVLTDLCGTMNGAEFHESAKKIIEWTFERPTANNARKTMP